MIEEIVIRDLGVISDAKLEFGPGLTVLTGETGAGKTMVLNALGLLLGNRSDTGAVRSGQEFAYIEGRWHLDNASCQEIAELGLHFEAPELIASRSVFSEGRSRASLSGKSVPVGVLSEVGEKLVIVHGQSDQIRLKSAGAQLKALDDFAGSQIRELLDKYQGHFESWKKCSLDLEARRSELANRDQESEELREALLEIDRLDPQPGEDESLIEIIKRLSHVEELKRQAAIAKEALSSEGYGESDDAQSLVGKARRALDSVSEHDPKLEYLAGDLQQIGYSLNELAAELAGYLTSLESDSAGQLEQAQQRRADLASLIRRFGPTLEDVLSFRESAQSRLLELDSSTDEIERLTAAAESELASCRELAKQISQIREGAAKELSGLVTKELAALAMPGASLEIRVSETELNALGKDQVAMLLCSYQGAEPRPLGKGASGGELSRIMLAIEVSLAKSELAPTMIFDEVDAGIGGSAAIEVGRRLRRLGKSAQVIVVTHLPQVAAFANQHLRVLKSSDREFTQADVVKLENEQIIEELTRMLSGLPESASGREHAKELLELAKAESI
jgi:DNA repair protein RecN (Recombination protein N)